MILRDQAQFELPRKLRGRSDAPIGDVFAFLSGLYFRGKIAYAKKIANCVLVLTIIALICGIIQASGVVWMVFPAR